MKTPFLALPILALLAACGPTVREGGGSLDGGASLKAERTIEPLTDHFRITSSEGWSCTGTVNYKWGNAGSDHDMPLTCTDGATGTAKVMYASPLRGHHGNLTPTITFTLSNGKKGTVRA